jgi:hypothetical protein
MRWKDVEADLVTVPGAWESGEHVRVWDTLGHDDGGLRWLRAVLACFVNVRQVQRWVVGGVETYSRVGLGDVVEADTAVHASGACLCAEAQSQIMYLL